MRWIRKNEFQYKPEDPRQILLLVNEDRDKVVFCLNAIRGDNVPIFWARVDNEAYHFHRMPHQKREDVYVKMSMTIIGFIQENRVAFFCEECGLRIVVPEVGATAEDLKELFYEKSRASAYVNMP